MNIPAHRLAAGAAVSGATALVLLASPGLARAAATGNAEVTVDGNAITVEFTNVASEDFLPLCKVIVTDNPATTLIGYPLVPITDGT